MAKWREVFRCILDVVLFLSERNLPFRGSTIKLDDPNNGLFLGNLELLSGHNQVLKMHLNEVKKHQDTETRMQAHYLSWRSQNEFIEECATIVINAITDEVKRALYYSIIADGTPDTSHTEQITFILRYAHLNEKNLWEVCERFLEINEELHLIKSLQDDLKCIREGWNVILEESKLVTGALSLTEQFQEKRRRIRKAFYDENRDNEWEVQNNEALFRINVFNVTLDTVISEVTRRFETSEQLNNMFSFLWGPSSITGQEDTENSDQSLSEDVENTCKDKIYCRNLSKFYPNDLNEDQILEELRLLNKLKQNDNLFGKLSSLQLLNKIYEKGLQSIFPQICVALRIFVSIPVSAASGERSFSKLAIVKNCRRSTMGQECLTGLITLSSERDIARKINYDTVIEAFASRCAQKARI